MISWDHMGPKSKDQKSEKIDALPILAGTDQHHKWQAARVLPSKGLDLHVVKLVSKELRLPGYSGTILKSDQEASILAFLEAVERERGEASELLAEEFPEHTSYGEIENAFKSILSHMRTAR